GLGNYSRLLSDPMFRQALYNTILYLIVQVPIMLFLGLIIAHLLNQPNLKFKGFYRTAIFLPCVTSLVSYFLLLTSICAFSEIFTKLLMNMLIINEPIAWLMAPVWARVVIIAPNTWR